MKIKNKVQQRKNRHNRLRSKISGTGVRPRLCVFRSNIHIYGQIIDDQKNKVLLCARDEEIKTSKTKSKEEGQLSGKIEKAFLLGQLIAKKAIKKGIKEVVFDRGGYKYHGRIKAFADGARSGELKF